MTLDDINRTTLESAEEIRAFFRAAVSGLDDYRLSVEIEHIVEFEQTRAKLQKEYGG